MYSPEQRAFLQKPWVARMSVIDRDGYPHTVPVCYVMDGDDLIITTERGTRKVAYVRENSRGAITIGGGFDDGVGYMLKGEFHVEEDPGLCWLKHTSHHYLEAEEAERSFDEFARKDMVVLRFVPARIIKVY
jgi:general stress protein 26